MTLVYRVLICSALILMLSGAFKLGEFTANIKPRTTVLKPVFAKCSGHRWPQMIETTDRTTKVVCGSGADSQSVTIVNK